MQNQEPIRGQINRFDTPSAAVKNLLRWRLLHRVKAPAPPQPSTSATLNGRTLQLIAFVFLHLGTAAWESPLDEAAARGLVADPPRAAGALVEDPPGGKSVLVRFFGDKEQMEGALLLLQILRAVAVDIFAPEVAADLDAPLAPSGDSGDVDNSIGLGPSSRRMCMIPL